ncbi:hypothetical protein ACFL52_04655 [Candidatus Margulisiibacteriota bacterium]
MKWIYLQKILKNKKIKLFSVDELAILTGCSKHTACRLAQRYTKKGIFLKIKKGHYLIADLNLPDLVLASIIYQPSYISFETALSYHHIIPETVYTCTSATPKITRQFKIKNKLFAYYKIKRGTFFGYKPTRIDRETVLLADPEKALADYLYFVSIGKRAINERFDLKPINKKKLKNYIKLFKRKKLDQIYKKLFV